MTLSASDKELLLNCGYSEDDIPQIQRAYQKSMTKYCLENTRITREKAISVLGWEAYLTGLARSAFHVTAVRETKNSEIVYFNSRNLFK